MATTPPFEMYCIGTTDKPATEFKYQTTIPTPYKKTRLYVGAELTHLIAQATGFDLYAQVEGKDGTHISHFPTLKTFRKRAFDQARNLLGLQGVKGSWSARAGCSCPCSPGFIMEHQGREMWAEFVVLPTQITDAQARHLHVLLNAAWLETMTYAAEYQEKYGKPYNLGNAARMRAETVQPILLHLNGLFSRGEGILRETLDAYNTFLDTLRGIEELNPTPTR